MVWLRGSCEIIVKMLAGAASNEGLTGAAGSASQTVHPRGCWQEASVPYRADRCIGCLRGLMTGQLAPPRINAPSGGGKESMKP